MWLCVSDGLSTAGAVYASRAPLLLRSGHPYVVLKCLMRDVLAGQGGPRAVFRVRQILPMTGRSGGVCVAGYAAGAFFNRSMSDWVNRR